MFNQENACISIEIEFYSEHNESSIATQISSLTNKKILNKKEEITSKFNLKLDNVNEKYKITSGFLPYSEIKNLMHTIFDWIKKNGKTSWDCDFCFNIEIGNSKLNPLKIILHYPEEKVYTLFPERKKYPHSKSIKNVYLSNRFYTDTLSSLSNDNFLFPFKKYYGIDFTSLDIGFLRFRYIGGFKYHENIEKCLTIINLSLDCLKHCVLKYDLTQAEKKSLDSILKDNKNIINSYISVDALKNNFPDITLMIDLSTNSQLINAFYPNIRDRLFKLLLETRMKKGYINYDSAQSKLQIKDAHIDNSYLYEGIDIFDSVINGNILNCDLFSTEIKNSDIFKSNLFNKSKATHSFFDQSYLNNNSTLNDCNITGDNTILSGIVEGGRIISGKIVSRIAKISDTTKIVSFEKIL